jgi:toxin secretion/phage lysis holin
MKENMLCAGIGAIGAGIAGIFGGWDAAMVTLIIFMAVDYVTGLIVAGVFHNSTKTETGALESKAGLKGLLRKGGMLLVVLVACRLDLLLGYHFIRDAVVIALISNEALSIIENLGLMGVPIPAPIINAIEVLKKQTENKKKKEDKEKEDEPPAE